MKKIIATATLLITAAGVSYAGSLPQKDRDFLQHDAQGSAYEMQLSQMAQQKAANPQLKQFAQQDISDHTALNRQAEQIAQQNGMTLSTAPEADKMAELNRLQTLTGPAFDTAYVKAMKAINTGDKNDFQSEESNTTNPQVKQFVQQAAATDRKHQAMLAAF